MSYSQEQRTSQRIQIEVPLYVNEEKTVTRDISWSGIYFLTNQTFSAGSEVSFCIDLNYALPGKAVKLDCLGEVLRIERHGDKYGVAAKINNFQYLH